MAERLPVLFIGAGSGAGVGAGHKRTGSATLVTRFETVKQFLQRAFEARKTGGRKILRHFFQLNFCIKQI